MGAVTGGIAIGCVVVKGVPKGVPAKGVVCVTNSPSGLFSALGGFSSGSSKMVLYITNGSDCVVRFLSTSFSEKDCLTLGDGTYCFLLSRRRYGSDTGFFP